MNTTSNSLCYALMIAYYYPPIEQTGTRRVVKFVKYLPQWGYQPVILTTRTRGSLPDDDATLTFRCDDLIGPFKRAYRAYKLRNVTQEQQPNIGLLSPTSKIEQFKRRYFIPNPTIIWYPLAVRTGLRVVRSLPIRVLYSTSPSETEHLIALRLKQLTGLPWVADFRDGWIFEPLIAERNTMPCRHQIEQRMEAAVIRAADAVVVVSDPMAEDFAHRYPYAREKISVITNGYDAEDFAHLTRAPAPSSATFRVVHTGNFSLSIWKTSIDGLLKAMKLMHDAELSIMKNLEIVLVGELSHDERTAIEQSGVREYFTIKGRVSYQEALQYQVDADVLLLVIASSMVSGSSNKLFEYLATGRPILALADLTSVAKYVHNLGVGLVVDPENVRGIQHALQTLHAQWKAGLLPTRINDRVRQFDRRALTSRLASLFDNLIEKTAG